jgi:hypothetical protein
LENPRGSRLACRTPRRLAKRSEHRGK